MKKEVKVVLIVPEKIRVNCEVWFKGESVEEALKELHKWAFFEQDFTEIEGCTFQISGDERLFEFASYPFHACFDHGGISVDKLLDAVSYEE